jgi:hypothetical protein
VGSRLHTCGASHSAANADVGRHSPQDQEPFRRIPSGYLDRRRRRWSSCVLSPSSSGDAKAPSPRLMGARRDDHSCGNEPLPQCPCSGGCDECRTVG